MRLEKQTFRLTLKQINNLVKGASGKEHTS
jgi:hypothetical protein